MRRRLLLLFAVLAVGVVVVLATIPFWLGMAAAHLGASRGFAFRNYERIGYSRFALHDVDVSRAGVRVTVTRAEASTPLLWAWRHWRGESDPIAVGEWRVEVARRPPLPAGAPKTPSGWVPLRAKLRKIAGYLTRWLPQAEAGAGSVHWPGGELALTGATWHDSELKVQGLSFHGLHVDGTARFSATADAITASVRSTAEPATATLESRGSEIAGEVTWLGQRAPVTAHFADSGWLPAGASVVADDWRVPGERIRLAAAYAEVRGGARLEWKDGKITADIHARGQPVPGKTVPPLIVNVQGQGTPDEFTIAALQAEVPGVNARLTQPVTLSRSGKVLGGSATRLTVAIDLAQQPWFPAQGKAEGEATLVSDLDQSPVIEFRMQASDVSAHDVALSSVEAHGRFQWPQLELTGATLTGGAGERIEVHGGLDLKTRTARDVVVEGRVRRTSLARWLPAQPQFDVIAIKARAQGPLATIEHQGEARAEQVKINGVNPLAIAAEWHGQGAAADRFKATATAGATQLQLGGAVDREGVRLQEVTLTRENALLLRLAGPAVIRWQPALQVESLHLAGPDGKLDAAVVWGKSGLVKAAGQNIPSVWLTDLVPLKGPAWKLDLLGFTGTWDNGPMTYALTVGATIDLGAEQRAAVVISSRGDKSGLQIEALRATEKDATVLNAVGHVPITLQPGGSQLLHIDEKGAIAFDATAAPHSAFWPKLAAATGVELKDPNAELHLKGTWLRPEGTVELKAAGIAIDPKRVKREIPGISGLNVQLTADRDGVSLRTFAVLVEGQAVRASGRVPLGEAGWTDLVKQPLALLEKNAEVHLEIPDAEIAVFTRFLPAVLAPKGRFAVDLKFERGGLNGRAQLHDAASRPLGPLGVLQEVNAEIELAGRAVTLRSVTAKAGGQPVSLTGLVEIPRGGAPRYDLALRGENLPFARQTGLLLRGDLDLKLQTPKEGAPRITGNVKLRDSLFLRDVRAFLPKGGGGGPARRPPYFAVETPPLNTWGLAVEVGGDRFMRLRTPVFNGVASAHFRLGGTLGEPRALGDVTIDEGNVRMPFANFDVKQGSVRLTEANPTEPQIYLRGTSRRYGYDLTMEIEGGASAPNIQFMSSPALESEQVLLMVMTGAVPSNAIAYTGTQRVAQIGAYLGQTLLGSLGGDSGNADRLSIASGEKISRQGRETYDIEYKLSDRWTATGEYNEYDEYNAGLKWRVLPRPKTEAREEKKNARK